MATHLDPARVPKGLHSLIPLAERWGIGDDIAREAAVDEASEEERRRLVSLVASAPDDLWTWLAGPESYEEPSREYVAFTCMTMAADSARVGRGHRT